MLLTDTVVPVAPVERPYRLRSASVALEGSRLRIAFKPGSAVTLQRDRSDWTLVDSV
jgi:hypothetical protein